MKRRYAIPALLILAALGWQARPALTPHSPVANDTPPAGRATSQRDHAKPAASATAAPPAPAFANGTLFAYSDTTPPGLDAELPAPAKKIYYVSVNRAWIDAKDSPFWQEPGRGHILIPLPGGGALPVTLAHTETLGPDRYIAEGSVDGAPGSRAVFAYNAGFLHASIDDPGVGLYELRVATEALDQFYEVDPARIGTCAAPVPQLDGDALAALAQRRLKQALAPRAAGDLGSSGDTSPNPPPVSAAPGTNVEVHVLVAYTQAILTTLQGTARTAAIQSAVDGLIAQVNSDFAASQISARVKLVGLVQTQYTPDSITTAGSTVESDALTALRQTSDGVMDEIHAARDASGADLVNLLIKRADSGNIVGLAYILATPGSDFNPIFGFSVVQYDNANAHVFSHELGHNFGCAHDRENATNQTGLDYAGAYSYSYGYRFFGRNGLQYHDIMAYDPGTRLGYFSTPNVTAPAPISVPVGIAAGQPGEADNARTVDESAFEVAAYRLQTQTAPNGGTLYTVATRAFVGAGDQQMIGGVIISGTAKKTILFRGAGPALAPFLTNFLADPVLTLYDSTGKPLYINDNWGDAPNASQITGLTAGSRDAGLLVSLDPGAYTIGLTGAAGSTGVARIDAYEADTPATTRIFALSTRAYADSTNPMIGGFVVNGSPGTTKRMVIRVRGPSITGVTTPMHDPYMELYNGTGDLILINDDWSTGASVGSDGSIDDNKPTVTQYKELQIFATGLAPTNRREPCVIVDLPPGSYTVVVKPFESLTSTPPQPAQPGVAAVDVFEVNP